MRRLHRDVTQLRQCLVCSKNTGDLKPYCLDHISLNVAANETARELVRRDREIAKASRGHQHHIDPDSSVCDDVVLVAIEQEGATMNRIAMDTRISLTAAKRYVSHLRARGILFRYVEVNPRDKWRPKIKFRYIPEERR